MSRPLPRWQKVALWAGAVYAVFWLGGSFSFRYTHECVRSHTEETEDANGRTGLINVCDWYVANGKRWTLAGPVQSVPWPLFAVAGVLAGGITFYALIDARRAKAAYVLQVERESHDRDG